MKKTIVALLSLVLMTGCFEIDQSINLEKNLSGTADFHLGVDLEPMVVIMAQFAHEMSGEKGPLTKEALAKARADFKKESKGKSAKDEVSRADIEKELPEGVKLLDYKMKEREFGIDSDFKFAFDRINRLINVKLPSKGKDPTQKNVIDSPFQGLELEEKGNTLTLRTKPLNPQEAVQKEAEGAPKLDAATEKLVRDAFGKMRVTYRVTAPFAIVSHNATRKEGNTLIWEYDLKRFEELEKSKKLEDAGVRVTYKR
jgi:hypothetical protein